MIQSMVLIISDNATENDISGMVGRNLRAIRLRQNMTQKQVGNLLGVSFQQIQKYETGQNQVSLAKLVRLCDIYDVPIEEFFCKIKVANPMRDKEILQQLSTLSNTALKQKIMSAIKVLIT